MKELLNVKLLCVLTIVTIFSGCTTAQFSKTGNFIAPPQEIGSDFAIYTIPPKGSFDEIGVVEFSGNFFNGAADGPSSIEAVKKKASKYVLQSGGNALLLWEANSFGRYKKATVIFVHPK